MIAPALPLDDCAHAACFDVVRLALMDDGNLKNVVKTWRTWSGEEDDARALSATGDAPWVELDPAIEGEAWFQHGSTRADLAIAVRGWVATTRKADVLNLWAAIRAALFPGDGSVDAALQDAGAMAGGYGLAVPQIGDLEDEDGTLGFPFAGRIRVAIAVATKL